MSSAKGKIIRRQVGHLPLARSAAERLGMKEIFLKHIKPHGNEKIPAADTLTMLLFNIACERRPLYELEEWVERADSGAFGCGPFDEGAVNDDRFGRALDKLYLADRATMMTDIVLSMIETTGLDLSRIHNDSTTVKAYGKIPGTTRSGLKLDYGFSKEHRPDLKQLVFALTISADGAVPVHYKTYEGNRTDDTTHIETWNTLASRIVGSPSFLYVADSKVCTDKQLSHITGCGGRVVTIVPETWKETKEFKNALRKTKKPRTVIWRRPVPGDPDRTEYFSRCNGEFRTEKGDWGMHWIFSSEKKKRDRDSRETALVKTERALAELSGKLNERKLKTKEAILDGVNQILEERGTERFFHVSLPEVWEEEVKQVGPGRPGPETRYKTERNKIYTLSFSRNRKALKEELAVDGYFPILSTDDALSAKEALIAYKYQPRLEKRFNQFRSVHRAGPLLFKSIRRVEAIMFLFFLALMAQAVIEREVRQKMKAKKLAAIPLYPEHRIAYHPTTARIFDRFEGVSTYLLEEDGRTTEYRDELTDLQKDILEMLDMSEADYWSEKQGR